MASRGLEAYRQQVRDQKRADILDAAQTVFLERGVRSVTMIEIADAARVSTATLYKHFASKDALFRDLATALLSARAAGANRRARTGVAALEAVLLNLVSADAAQADRFALLRLMIAEPELAGAAGADFASKLIELEHREVRVQIEALVESGRLAPHDIAVSTAQLVGMVKEQLFWPRMFDGRFRPRRLRPHVAACVQVILKAYGAESSRRSPDAR